MDIFKEKELLLLRFMQIFRIGPEMVNGIYTLNVAKAIIKK